MEDKKQEEVNKYITLRPNYIELSHKIASIIDEVLISKKINYHVITSRAKEIDSFKFKIENPKYNDPFNQITDLSGIRVIAYVEDDVKKICEIIEGLFKVDKKNSLDKSEELGTDKVGYKSVHFICELPNNRIELPEYSKFKKLKFEIQIRTILQHSWAEIEHDKNYKFQGELPNEIKRRFKLLAGTLELIDREFNQLSKEIDTYSLNVEKKTKKGELEIPINSTSLKQYLNTKFESMIQKFNLNPNFNGSHNESLIINELQNFGVKTLKDLDLLLPKKVIQAFDFEYQEHQNFLGILRESMLVNNYKKYFEKSFTGSWTGLSNDADERFFEKFGIQHVDVQKELDLALARIVEKNRKEKEG